MSTHVCGSCSREVDLVPMLSFPLLNQDRTPVEFVCGGCGDVLGKMSWCPGCEALIMNNLAGKENEEPHACILHGTLSMAGARMIEL